MNQEELQQIAQAASKNIKTEQDLNEFRQMLTKITLETALNAELDDHLGYSKHERTSGGNSRRLIGVRYRRLIGLIGVRYKLNVILESIALCAGFFKSLDYLRARNYYLLTKDENNS